MNRNYNVDLDITQLNEAIDVLVSRQPTPPPPQYIDLTTPTETIDLCSPSPEPQQQLESQPATPLGRWETQIPGAPIKRQLSKSELMQRMKPRKLFPEDPAEMKDEDDAICLAALLEVEYIEQANGQHFLEEEDLSWAHIVGLLAPFSENTQKEHDGRRALFAASQPAPSSPPPTSFPALDSPASASPTATSPNDSMLQTPPTPPMSLSPEYPEYPEFVPYTDEEKRVLLEQAGRERMPYSLVANQESAAAQGFFDYPPLYKQWRTFADVDFY